MLVGIAEYRIAIQRIDSLLLADELDVQPEQAHDEKFAIKISNGEFIWEAPAQEDEPQVKKSSDSKKSKKDVVVDATPEAEIPVPGESHLRNINLQIPHGALVAIVGKVGSGKSSLLNAMIGEMKRVSGETQFSGTLSYAPQKAWIQNSTVKVCSFLLQGQHTVWITRRSQQIRSRYTRLFS